MRIAPSLFILMVFMCVSQSIKAQVLEITISNVQNTSGRLCIAIFDNDHNYREEKPFAARYLDKDTLMCTTVKVDIPVCPGTYGLTVLDDEDGNEKLTLNFLGIPKEGFGFSNYTLKGLRRPHFDHFSFTVNRDE